MDWDYSRSYLHRNLKTEDELDKVRSLDRQIWPMDEEIDNKVYELYGLTEEEIKIVEGK